MLTWYLQYIGLCTGRQILPIKVSAQGEACVVVAKNT